MKCRGAIRSPPTGASGFNSRPSSYTLPDFGRRKASRTTSGVSRLAAPRSSSAPQRPQLLLRGGVLTLGHCFRVVPYPPYGIDFYIVLYRRLSLATHPVRSQVEPMMWPLQPVAAPSLPKTSVPAAMNDMPPTPCATLTSTLGTCAAASPRT